MAMPLAEIFMSASCRRTSSCLPRVVIRIAPPGGHLAEVAVDGGIVGQLGVKRRYENCPLAGHDRLTLARRQDLHLRSQAPDAGCADVDHLHRDLAAVQRGDAVLFERLPLAAIGVALDARVD